MDFCTMRGCLMPIAVCVVDFGLRRALRHNDEPRPVKASKDVIPLRPVRLPTAYPSGTTLFGGVTAIVLANMVPEKRYDLFERGQQATPGHLRLGLLPDKCNHSPASFALNNPSATSHRRSVSMPSMPGNQMSSRMTS